MKNFQNQLIDGLQKDSMQYYNFSGNQTAFGYEGDPDYNNLLNFMENPSAFGYDANAFGYDANAFGYNGATTQMPGRWTKEAVAAANLTTYKLRIIWAVGTGGDTKNPVDIQLFRSAFNTGTWSGNDLVFTNSAGNTATIKGLTMPFKQLIGITETEPFTIAFARITPKSLTQLDNQITVQNQTQWKSGYYNSIGPDEYIDPYQMQTLRVDVPMNIPVDKKKGFDWTIDSDQDGNGCGMVLFVSNTWEATKALQDKPVVSNLGGGVNQQFYTPVAPAGQIRHMIAAKELMQNAAQRFIPQSMKPMLNQAFVKPMIPGMMAAGATSGMAALGAAAPALMPFAPLLATPMGQNLVQNLANKFGGRFRR
jgi:hypothetical protein